MTQDFRTRKKDKRKFPVSGSGKQYKKDYNKPKEWHSNGVEWVSIGNDRYEGVSEHLTCDIRKTGTNSWNAIARDEFGRIHYSKVGSNLKELIDDFEQFTLEND